MAKTSMQTLIEWGDKMMLEHPMKTLSFAEAIDKAVELLEMEREQIEDAYYDGQSLNAKSVTRQMIVDNSISYYNETYNQ